MRDFAKTNKNTATRSNEKATASRKSTPQTSLALRKLVLALLLLILIIAFFISFYSNKQSKTAAPETTPKAQTTSKQNTGTVLAPESNAKASPTTPDTINTTPHITDNTAKTTDQTASTTNADTKEPKDQPLTFTFYDTLTNKTVQVDANPEKLKQYRYIYMLQIGSYRNQSDANATRAKLILAGLKPTLKKVGDWYRLDVGPVYNTRDGDVLKHKVEAAGISGSILRQVDKQEITPQTTSDNQ